MKRREKYGMKIETGGRKRKRKLKRKGMKRINKCLPSYFLMKN